MRKLHKVQPQKFYSSNNVRVITVTEVHDTVCKKCIKNFGW